MKIKNIKKFSRKSRTTIVLVVVIVSYVILSYFFKLFPFTPSDEGAINGNSVTEQYVSMDQSDTEKSAIDELKHEPDSKVENSQTDTPASPALNHDGMQNVNVLLTNAGIFNGKVSASGLVTDTTEKGGVCTYKFSNNSTVVTKVSATLANPTSVSCETVSFSDGELGKSGTWKVWIVYSSINASGTSNVKEFVK